MESKELYFVWLEAVRRKAIYQFEMLRYIRLKQIAHTTPFSLKELFEKDKWFRNMVESMGVSPKDARNLPLDITLDFTW